MEFHREEEEGDRGDQEERMGGVKRKETNLACDQFPKCSPSPKHPKRFTELSRKEKGEGGDRGDLEEKKESKEREQ